jgi:prepilin-type N-terminal cleavage/methylation domain-containing protein
VLLLALVRPGLSINIINQNYSARNGDQGFTLVESLIAILLLGIIFSGGMAFYYLANALYYSGLHSRQATSIASSMMEVCKNVGYASLPSLPGGACSVVTDQPLPLGPLSSMSGTSTVAVSDVGNVKQVTVTVSWADPNKGPSSITLQTYVGS